MCGLGEASQHYFRLSFISKHLASFNNHRFYSRNLVIFVVGLSLLPLLLNTTVGTMFHLRDQTMIIKAFVSGRLC